MTLKDNAEELALIAQEIGARLMRVCLRYEGRKAAANTGDGQL